MAWPESEQPRNDQTNLFDFEIPAESTGPAADDGFPIVTHTANTNLADPLVCEICFWPLPNVMAVALHKHEEHRELFNADCPCEGCNIMIRQQQQVPTSPDGEQNAPAPPQPTTQQISRVHQPAPAPAPINPGISEDHLPALMGKLEAGSFITKKGVKKWSLGALNKAPPLLDANRQPVFSITTGNRMRSLPFLPHRISSNITGWEVTYWERLAAEQGLSLVLNDLVDRMVFTANVQMVMLNAEQVRNQARNMSMRAQRWRESMGVMPLHPKTSDGSVHKQEMRALEELTVMQGMLNTVWLPSHVGDVGPWMVVQPEYHPEYREISPRGPGYESTSYIVEKAYGLSDNVRRISDWMVYLDARAVELGMEVGRRSREQIWENTGLDEFERWLGCMDRGLSMAKYRKAFDNMTVEWQFFTVMAGDERVVEMLQDEILV